MWGSQDPMPSPYPGAQRSEDEALGYRQRFDMCAVWEGSYRILSDERKIFLEISRFQRSSDPP